MSRELLIDAGPLLALHRSTDDAHGACKAYAGTITRPMSTCWPVLTEVLYLARDEPATRAAVLETIRHGVVRLLHLDTAELPAIFSLLDRYTSLKLQFADACLLHLADREGVEVVFTLDRRDFTAARTPKGRALQVVPEGR